MMHPSYGWYTQIARHPTHQSAMEAKGPPPDPGRIVKINVDGSDGLGKIVRATFDILNKALEVKDGGTGPSVANLVVPPYVLATLLRALIHHLAASNQRALVVVPLAWQPWLAPGLPHGARAVRIQDLTKKTLTSMVGSGMTLLIVWAWTNYPSKRASHPAPSLPGYVSSIFGYEVSVVGVMGSFTPYARLLETLDLNMHDRLRGAVTLYPAPFYNTIPGAVTVGVTLPAAPDFVEKRVVISLNEADEAALVVLCRLSSDLYNRANGITPRVVESLWVRMRNTLFSPQLMSDFGQSVRDKLYGHYMSIPFADVSSTPSKEPDVCPVCLNPPKNPVKLACKCSATFCHICIATWLYKNETPACTNCRFPVHPCTMKNYLGLHRLAPEPVQPPPPHDSAAFQAVVANHQPGPHLVVVDNPEIARDLGGHLNKQGIGATTSPQVFYENVLGGGEVTLVVSKEALYLPSPLILVHLYVRASIVLSFDPDGVGDAVRELLSYPGRNRGESVSIAKVVVNHLLATGTLNRSDRQHVLGKMFWPDADGGDNGDADDGDNGDADGDVAMSQ